MGKIVYHGTWSPAPPHKYGAGFHAGTLKSTEDRYESGEGVPEHEKDFGVWTVHAYDIGNSQNFDPVIHRDPHAGDTYDTDIWKNRRWSRLPSKATGVHQYINDHEDRGSTSYFVSPQHSELRYLGPQFHRVDPTTDLGHSVLSTATVMLGGKSPKRQTYE